MSTASSVASSSTRPARKRVFHIGSAGMLLGGLLAIVGSLLPWVSTPLGSLSGMAGPGLWTLSSGFLAVGGALMPYRRVALSHAALAGLTVIGLAAWQVARIIEISSATNAWGELLPGMGLVMVAGSGVILLRTAWRVYRI